MNTARGNAIASLGAFASAAELAGRSGAVMEEATYLTGLAAAAVDAGPHGAELGADDVGDLLIAEALDVTQHDGRAEVRRQRREGTLDVVVEGRVGVRRVGSHRGAGQPGGALVGERIEADPLLAAGLVEEEVRGDAVQPALEGAGRVRRQRAEHADEDLLREVLGVVGVAGQPVGEAVDPGGVLRDDLVPGRRLPRLGRVRACLGALTRRLGHLVLLGPDR